MSSPHTSTQLTFSIQASLADLATTRLYKPAKRCFTENSASGFLHRYCLYLVMYTPGLYLTHLVLSFDDRLSWALNPGF